MARHVLAIGSGKGGVGKSTVSLNLALALAADGAAVGLLDADFYGPSIPLMLGLKRERWQGDWEMAGRNQPPIPPVERFGLKVMSAGFIIAEDQPMILDGQTIVFLMRQLITRVQWGDLDYLLIDLPPGTADVQQHLLRLLSLSAAIVVVTPQDAAHLDARKAVQMFRRAKVPVLGAIENMSAFLCPHCDQPIEVFPRVAEERSVWSAEVERLGSIPLDPALSAAGDRGAPVVAADPASPRAQAFRQIAGRVQALLDAPR
jgi:ATP-binding protein involved in chromosome partitioning